MAAHPFRDHRVAPKTTAAETELVIAYAYTHLLIEMHAVFDTLFLCKYRQETKIVSHMFPTQSIRNCDDSMYSICRHAAAARPLFGR